MELPDEIAKTRVTITYQGLARLGVIVFAIAAAWFRLDASIASVAAKVEAVDKKVVVVEGRLDGLIGRREFDQAQQDNREQRQREARRIERLEERHP